MKRHRPRVRAFVRGGLAVGMVAAGGCADVHSDNPNPPSEWRPPDAAAPDSGGSTFKPIDAAPPLEAPDAARPLPLDFLVDQSISNALPIQRVLYSWTTIEQYDELRARSELLMRTERPGQGGGLIRTVLADLAANGDALAQALTAPEFQKARYAWPNPWATLLGWPGETYGNKLIRIELREEAWVMAVLGTESRVIDLSGAQVPMADALANPQRIGAVFHSHLSEDLICYGSFSGGGAGSFREYFLPNAAMIARWSLDTQAMRDRLVADIEVLTAYRDHQLVPASPLYGRFETLVSCSWKREEPPVPGEPPFDAYVQALALASPLYDPTVENLNALIAALELALFEPNPFVQTDP